MSLLSLPAPGWRVVPSPRSAAPAIDFAGLIGATAWQRLAPAIRDRFAAKPTPARPIRYAGTMHRVECSVLGWCLAQGCRLIGTPFAPHRGEDVPVTITLRSADAGRGVAWARTYHYAGRPAAEIGSTKRMAADGTLTEQIGAGFAMRLALFEADGALHFQSRGYVWQHGRWRLPLPDWLSPGTAHVRHEDLGTGRFRFVMTIRHRLFGTLFHQDGVFQEQGSLP